MNPSDGSEGVVEDLRDRDLSGLLVDQGGIGERPSDVDRQTHAHAVPAPQFAGGFLVELASVDHDPVLVAGALHAHLALEHVAQDALGLALLGRPVAAAAAAADADHVAGHELDRALRAEPGLAAIR